MKIILSRKGFDSSAGGYPSPILPDGTMLSLPIPSGADALQYDDLVTPRGKSIGQIMRDLAIDAGIGLKGAHLDPDLIEDYRPRRSGWRPSLGQIGAAAGHLRKQKVTQGDLFLFYGWFRQTEEIGGRLRFRVDEPGVHAIFGYLEVDQILYAPRLENLPEWLWEHPHAIPQRLIKPTNTLYLASEKLTGNPLLAGAGTLRFQERLTLTQQGMPRSRWRLDPAIFRHLAISYHQTSAWKQGYFQSYPRAQEYVVEADKRAADWALNLISYARLPSGSLSEPCP